MNTCKHCKTEFEIFDKDREFYQMMEVPEPTLCYLCRMQRRLSYRSERFLYHRKCDLTGKQIISTYSTDNPFPVYYSDEWWSDRYDPLKYGREFDFKRPFFEQFFELRNVVPRLNLIQQKPMFNSEYCNAAGNNKNCYLAFSSNSNEDCYYISWCNYCKNCIDCKTLNKSELCYECVDCRDCYGLRYSQDCANCSDSAFLRNCQGCRDCFGCSNQKDKQYYIFNKPFTETAYKKFMKEVDLSSNKTVEKIKERIDDEFSDLIVKEYEGMNNQDSLGNYLRNNKNAYMCFDCEDCEDIRYCMALFRAKNSMDHSYWGDGTEKIYECQACGFRDYNLRFCNLCWSECSDLTYCDHCFSSRDCFGSVGLKKNQYLILNKQYSKEEYFKLVPKIIEHMKETSAIAGQAGEWGEFFPTSHSLYGYNETLAQEEVPLIKGEVLKRGWRWKDVEKDKSYKGAKYQIADKIAGVPEDICMQILISEKSGEPYKIIPQELKFLKENGIPVPRITPDERHWARMEKRNPRKLYDRTCAKCGADIRTTYAPDRPEIVYCEKCYLKEVY